MTRLMQLIVGTRGADIVGPRNPEVGAQSPDILIPPSTDHVGIPNLKFPFAMAHKDISLNTWLALTPRHLVEGHLDVGEPLMSALRPPRQPLVKG